MCAPTACPVLTAFATIPSYCAEGRELVKWDVQRQTTPLDTYVIGYSIYQGSHMDMPVIVDIATLEQHPCQKLQLLASSLPKTHSSKCLVAPSSSCQESKATQLSDAPVHLSPT